MMESEVFFIEPIGDHGVRVALELLDHTGALESMETDVDTALVAWTLIESSRPWSDRAWGRAFAAASRRVSDAAPAGYATDFLVVAMARESRAHPGRAEELEALAQRASASGAPWSAVLDKVLRIRRDLRPNRKETT